MCVCKRISDNVLSLCTNPASILSEVTYLELFALLDDHLGHVFQQDYFLDQHTLFRMVLSLDSFEHSFDLLNSEDKLFRFRISVIGIDLLFLFLFFEKNDLVYVD